MLRTGSTRRRLTHTEPQSTAQRPTAPCIVMLTKRRQFVAMRDSGSTCVMPGFVLQYRPLGDMMPQESLPQPSCCAVGYTVTKKLGNAVRRNRIKRRLRAAVAQAFPQSANAGYAYVLIGRHRSDTVAFNDLVSQLRSALRRAHAPKASSPQHG